MTSLPLFSVRNLRRSWVTRGVRSESLRGIDLTIASGEYVAIRGPSGSGKSTLLRLLGALDSGYEGDILVDGRALSSMSDRERSRLRSSMVGFVFQSFQLLSHLTVLENLLVPSLWHADRGPKRAQLHARALDLLRLVGMETRQDAFPDALSGGQQQRVAIARALIMEPRVLLCDEPTGSLDSTNSRIVLELLERLRAELGMTLVIATHDPSVMERAERQIELVDGAIVSDRRSDASEVEA